MMRWHRLRRLRRQEPGSVLVLGGAIILVLVLMIALVWQVSYRVHQRQVATDALRESTRTAAQGWQYASFATGTASWQGSDALTSHARTLLAANLAHLPGLAITPHAAAKEATFTVLPAGSMCGNTVAPAPALCTRMSIPVDPLPIGPRSRSILTVSAMSVLDATGY